MAQFCSIKGFSHDLLWAEWLRPYYLLTDLCPSAWSCECCLTQNLFATGKGMPPTYIPLNAFLFWAASWNRLLDLGCCFSSYVSTLLYPQPGFALATDATEPVPWPWFCPIMGKAPFSGSVTAPSYCSSWSCPENPDIGPSTLYLSCKLTAKEWLCPLGRSIFWLSHLQLHFSRLLLQCHFSQASNFSFLPDPFSILSLFLLPQTVAGLDYLHPADWKVSHHARPQAGAEWLRTRSENQVLRIYFNQFERNVQMSRPVPAYWLASLEPFKTSSN